MDALRFEISIRSETRFLFVVTGEFADLEAAANFAQTIAKPGDWVTVSSIGAAS